MLKHTSFSGAVALAAALALLAWAASSIQGQDPVAFSVQIVSSESLADAGDKEGARLVVAVNDAMGPVGGLTLANFVVDTRLVPPSGCAVDLTRVNESRATAGAYLLDLIPAAANASCIWLQGRYLFSVLVNGPTGSGVGVVELVVDPQ